MVYAEGCDSVYKHFDFKWNIKSPKTLDTKQAIKEHLNIAKEIFERRTGMDTTRCIEEMETERHMENRRVQALYNSTVKIKSEHADCINDWVTMNIANEGYRALEQKQYILYAAAIWVLDCLSDAGVSFDEVYKLLPREKETIKPLIKNHLSVCGYSDELAASVEYVLRYRNIDIPSTSSYENDTDQALTNTISAAGAIDHSVPSRQNFEKLLALIPQDKIDSAVSKFKECYDEWCRRYFHGVEHYIISLNNKTKELHNFRYSFYNAQKAINNNMSGIQAITDELMSKTDSMITTSERKRRRLMKKALNKGQKEYNKLINQNLKYYDQNPPQIKSELPQNMSIIEMLGYMNNSNKVFEEIYGELHALDDKLFKFQSFIKENGIITPKLCKESFDGELMELTEPMPSADPYELCFALLYLIEQDDDIPWLYGSCMGMLRSYLMELPWFTTNIISNHNDNSFPAWYELPNRYQNDKSDSNFNLSQVIFSATRTVMPRHIKNIDETLNVFNTYNIDANKSLDLLYMLNSLRETKECIPALNLDKNYMSKLCGEHSDEQKVDSAELQKKITELEQEVKHLRSQLHDADKKASDIESEYNTFKEEVKNEKRELYDLRELIFMDTADKQDETTVDDKKFPYEVQHNTVIFGGFDNWRNAIKPLLKGNVRLIPRDMKNFDVSIIRNSDIIWIQINSISHSSYYKIIDTAKPYNKQIRYFFYGSAAKCAEQLADNDTSIE